MSAHGSPTVGPTPAEPAYPLRTSEDGRYFVDQNGAPVFWLGTTQWQILHSNTQEDARAILANVKSKGFTVVQAMIAGVDDAAQPGVHGEKPWHHDNPLTPNEAYFRHVDGVVRAATELNVVLAIMLYHQRWRASITEGNARAWARWLAARYRDNPCIVWSLCPEATDGFVPVLRELAAGLRDGDGGRHLITVHPDPAPYCSRFVHHERWLDFHSIQTWRSVELIYPMVTADRALEPAKPVVMAEGAYEAGWEYGFDVTPLWVRRQAYYSYLAGGHHSYGHNDSWRMLPTWRQALDAPGAFQMGLLRQTLTALPEWWRLTPDESLFAEGGRTEGRVLHLGARHAEGRWLVAYLAEPTTFALNLALLADGRRARACWTDPRTGESAPAGEFSGRGTQKFTTPKGWEDALLFIEPMDL